MHRTQFSLSLFVVLLAAALLCAQEPGAPTAPAPAQPAREKGLYMKFETTMGTITCKLFENETPTTVGKIVGLATGRIGGKRFYDGLTFHRLIPGFMIQGGDPTGTGMGGPSGPGFPFKDEFIRSLRFDVPGRLAMANAGPNTNSSQFFITEVPTPHLNDHHTIFGQCENLDVVKAIARVPRGPSDKPKTPVVIKRVIIERVGPEPEKPEPATRKAKPA